MLSLDRLPINKTENLLEQVFVCINGELNNTSIGFFNSIHKFNALGLADLVTKLNNNHIQPNAEMVDLVVQAITDQLQIPSHAMQTMNDFFLDSEKQNKLLELQALKLNEVKMQHSIFHMMSNLNLFAGSTATDQFIRTALSIMLDWESQPQRTIKEAARWLKTVLNIPYKSPMAQIIQLMADHLHLSTCLMNGKTRQMDGLELFFLLKNLTHKTEMVLMSEVNKPFILQLNATLLAIMIYKNSPNAFYDVAQWHAQHAEYAILSQLNQHYPNMVLADFLNSASFKPYFSQQRYDGNQVNHHIFICSLADYFHALLQTDYTTLDQDQENIVFFLQECVNQFQDQDHLSFLDWLAKQNQLESLSTQLWPSLLHALQTLALTKKSRQAGRIRTSAMQLMGLGFSHRSVSTLTTGVFKPLVNIDIAEIDTTNIAALIAFFNQQTQANRIRLLQEMILGYLVYNKSLSLAQQENKKIAAAKAKALTLINAPKYKSITPQLYRANPLNRNRMFTPKLLNKESPVYSTTPIAVVAKMPENHSPLMAYEPIPVRQYVTLPVHPGEYKKAAIKRRKRALARKLAKKRRRHTMRCHRVG